MLEGHQWEITIGGDTMKYFRTLKVFSLMLLGYLILPAEGRPAAVYLSQAAGPSTVPSADLIMPQELASSLKSDKSAQSPVILQIGPRVLYAQAHIPGSEYIGATNTPEGIQQLRKRIESLPRTQSIILYCGCCPWKVCPNVNPAYEELRRMGFKSVKVLYLAENFGKDWVEKGFPTEKGQ
jgi:hypothetical protein